MFFRFSHENDVCRRCKENITISLGGLFVFIGFVCIIQFVGEDNFMTLIYLPGLVLFWFSICAIGNVQTISSDLFRGPSVGTLAGLAGTIAAVLPMIMNWFIGRITTESYTPAFIAITVSVISGVLSIFILIKTIEPVRKTTEE